MRNGTKPGRSILATLVVTAALAAPGTAGAGLLTTDTASDCDPDISQVFRPWKDSAYYRLSPGGDFEARNRWSLSGGARIVSGNEPFFVRSPSDSRSLYLPAGATATSPTMCFSFGDWHARFFARSVGSGGYVKVDILVRNLLGLLSVLDGGMTTAGGDWAPSPRMSALVSNVGALLSLNQAVAIRLSARGTGAAFQVDDVYLDPFRSR